MFRKLRDARRMRKQQVNPAVALIAVSSAKTASQQQQQQQDDELIRVESVDPTE
jgi:hypothetical protein